MTKKKFDCVEMKHKAQKKIWDKLNKMTLADQLTYWGTAAKKMRKRLDGEQKRIKQKPAKAVTV